MNSRSTAIERFVNAAGQDGAAADTGHLQKRIFGNLRLPGPAGRIAQLRADEFGHAYLSPKRIVAQLLMQLVGQENRGTLHSGSITYIWRYRRNQITAQTWRSALLHGIQIRDQVGQLLGLAETRPG